MPSLNARRRDFVRRFNAAGAEFPEAWVSGYVRQGAQATYSQHRYGLAVDVKWPGRPSSWPMARIRAAAAREGLVMIDERTRTSANWTGPHIHFQRYPGARFREMVRSGAMRA